ncbi:FadR/GntR family transcriptional regulator [Desulfallas thermosapovorans]|uniref:Transcriptional regulator, GntR family n=1 Tax=Desulfallas thermosapovorans DSM 6562 TaxID=1121431 RepID=A0A5S4ZVL7_9FIRM|nr:FadR/GntR family transcriptional regulator [Desulfallas thermosapovorans]TYO96898.1 transcriptional regulator, GntR family [Desulfallas thermosapovorans DSM 6562]
MYFKPIKTRKIYEEIIEQVKEMINKGVLNPGDRLMTEREMAEKMQVGRSAVREALRALEAMGIIKVKPGEGTFINDTTPDALLRSFSTLAMDDETARELMELRKILEVEAAVLAAKRSNEKQLKAMSYALQQMEQDLKEGNLGEMADMNFHFAIAQAAGNSLLYKLMNTIADTMTTLLAVARQRLYLDPVNPPRLLREHKVIYRAISNSDAAAARKAMLQHLTGVEEYMFGK